jgi:hypothetical protein
MSSTTTHGIRYPDRNTRLIDLASELVTMAGDIDAYIFAKAITGPTGDRGPQGLAGTGGNTADTAVASYVSTTGTSATKTALNDFLAAKPPPAETVTSSARIHLIGNLDLGSGTPAVPMNTTTFVQGSDITARPTGNTAKLVVVKSGLYLIQSQLSFANGTAGARTGIITINASNTYEFQNVGTSMRLTTSIAVPLLAGDAVGLSVYTEGAPTTAGIDQYDVGLSLTRIGL